MDYLFCFAWCVFFIVIGLFTIADIVLYRYGGERKFIFAEIFICAMCACIVAYLICKMFAM